jgi:hypothetical protein
VRPGEDLTLLLETPQRVVGRDRGAEELEGGALLELAVGRARPG